MNDFTRAWGHVLHWHLYGRLARGRRVRDGICS